MCSIQNFTADRWSSPNSLDYKLVLRSLFLLVKVRSCRDIPRHSQSFTHSILKTEDQQITLGSLVFDWDIKIEKSIDTTTPPQHDYHHRHCCNPHCHNLVKFQDMGKCRTKTAGIFISWNSNSIRYSFLPCLVSRIATIKMTHSHMMKIDKYSIKKNLQHMVISQ